MAGGIIYDDSNNQRRDEILMAERINENFNQAIDIIVSKKIENLPFDRTEVGLIEEKGENNTYTVNNGSITYSARAQNGTKYEKGQKVYVSIPNNDYDNIKTITGLCAGVDINPDNYYVNIFDSFVDVTGNVLENTNIISLNNVPTSAELIANRYNLEYGQERFYFVGDENSFYCLKTPLVGYNVFAISFDLNTMLSGVSGGTYGIGVELWWKKDNTKNTDSEEGEESQIINMSDFDHIIYEWTSSKPSGYSDFSGNPYIYNSYVTQQFRINLDTINLPGLKNIVGLRVYVYQNNDFIKKDGTRFTYNEESIKIFPNILFRNLKLDFGLKLEDFQSGTDSLTLVTPDSLYYTRTSEEETFIRQVNLNWIHIFNQLEETSDTIPLVLNNKNDFDKYFDLVSQLKNLKIYWYEWTEVASEEDDGITGKFWKKLEGSPFYWTAAGEQLLEPGEWTDSRDSSSVDFNPFSLEVKIPPNTLSATYKVYVEYGPGVRMMEVNGEEKIKIESEEITFYATVPTAEGLLSKDLIEGLVINVKDGTRGQYYLYDQETNQLFSSIEKNKIRKLEISYNPAAQAQNVQWPFPINSMLYWKVPKTDSLLTFKALPEGNINTKIGEEENEVFAGTIHLLSLTEELSEIQTIFKNIDDRFYYYKITFATENLEAQAALNYIEYTLHEEYNRIQTENYVECKLYDSNNQQICGGRQEFFFSFQPPSSALIVTPYWDETFIWKITGNKNEQEEDAGTIKKTYEIGLKNPEALPVGGYLSETVNYRYATRIGLKIYGYNKENSLFNEDKTSFSDVMEVLTNASVSLGKIYNREINDSVLGGNAVPVFKTLSNGTVSPEGFEENCKIEGQGNDTKTGNSLIFYENNLYYISPLGTGGQSNSNQNIWIYNGNLQDAWPEVINFACKQEKGSETIDGQEVALEVQTAATLPVHFFKSDINFSWENIDNIDDVNVTCNYNLQSGSDLVVYNENNSIISGSAERYSLATVNNVANVNWRVVYLKKENNTYTRVSDTSSDKYFRIVDGYLQHQTNGMPVEKAFFIEAYDGNGICYKLPLRLIQKRYGLSLLADWDGQNTPAIFGEGVDGAFSGVFSGYNSIQRYTDNELVKDGNSSKIEETNSIYGFYGYQEGFSTFALQNKDPYVVINGLTLDKEKNVTGQVSLLEVGLENYILQSANYSPPNPEENIPGYGMQINLKEGTINAHDVNSVLYAKEIEAFTSINISEEKQVVDENSGESITEIVPVVTVDKTGITAPSVDALQLSATGSFVAKISEDSDRGLFIQTEDNNPQVILRGGYLQNCIFEGTINAEKAVFTNITIDDDGTIKWQNGASINQNTISNIDTSIGNINTSIGSINTSISDLVNNWGITLESNKKLMLKQIKLPLNNNDEFDSSITDKNDWTMVYAFVQIRS